jgi:hypothetical protein
MYLTTIRHRPAEALAEEFMREGFMPGAPKCVPPEVVILDARIWRRSRCPVCRKPQRSFRPYFKDAHYRAVVRCRHCNHGEEV